MVAATPVLDKYCNHKVQVGAPLTIPVGNDKSQDTLAPLSSGINYKQYLKRQVNFRQWLVLRAAAVTVHRLYVLGESIHLQFLQKTVHRNITHNISCLSSKHTISGTALKSVSKTYSFCFHLKLADTDFSPSQVRELTITRETQTASLGHWRAKRSGRQEMSSLLCGFLLLPIKAISLYIPQLLSSSTAAYTHCRVMTAFHVSKENQRNSPYIGAIVFHKQKPLWCLQA